MYEGTLYKCLRIELTSERKIAKGGFSLRAPVVIAILENANWPGNKGAERFNVNDDDNASEDDVDLDDKAEHEDRVGDEWIISITWR